MDELLREFLTETNESLDVVDVELVRFEQEPNNAKILDNIFRLVHTIKGHLRLSRAAAAGSARARRRNPDGQVPRRHAGHRRGRHADPVHHRPHQGTSRRARAAPAEPEGDDEGSDRAARADGDGGRRLPPSRRQKRRRSRPSALSSRRWNARCARARSRSTSSSARSARRRARRRRRPASRAAGAAARQGRAQAARGRRGQAGQGRQPVDPRQRRHARTPDDHGLRAGAHPQPAARDRAPARGPSSRCRCSGSPTSPPSCRKAS